jgi:signal transduction histidine kinase
VVVPMPPDLRLGQRVPTQLLAQSQRIEVNGVFIGTILSPPLPPGLTPQEQAYLDRTNQALTLAALGAALLALVVGFLLARTLTRPLRALTLATEKMAGGDLNQQVSREVARANQLRKQMTADIAHDLRTPLTVIAGYVESMRDGDLAPTPERLDTIYAEIERLQRLVSDLRLLAHTDAGELRLNLQSLRPKELLESAAASFKLSAEQKGITLTVDVSDDLPLIQADESRMNRVLANLISNALRHTPSGGSVSILATRRDKNILLTIADTGEGIPPADLPHIFDRFYRADKSRADADGPSSGLGLAIAKALVEAHGGRIWAESEKRKGTRMRVELPTE